MNSPVKEELKHLLVATGGNLREVAELAEKRGIPRGTTFAILSEIDDEAPDFIPDVRGQSVSDNTRTADVLAEHRADTRKRADRVLAQQKYGNWHKFFPNSTEAALHDDGIHPVAAFKDAWTLLGRAGFGALGKGLEGWGDALDIDYLRHLPSTDMDNPEGIGNDYSLPFVAVGAPAKIGATVVRNVAGSGAKALAKNAARKGVEYGADFGIGYLANKPFDNGIEAGDAALGTASGFGMDVVSTLLTKAPGGKILGKAIKTPVDGIVAGAEKKVHDAGTKLKKKGVETAESWMRPTKSQDMKAGGLDAEVLLQKGPDGKAPAIRKGAKQMDVKERIDDVVQKMHEQRGELWKQTDEHFAAAAQNPTYVIKPGDTAPLPVNVDDIGQRYVDKISDDVAHGKLFSVEDQDAARKFWEKQAQDAENYATGAGIFGGEQPYWRGKYTDPVTGEITFYRNAADVPAGGEFGLFVSPHQLQYQSSRLYDKSMRDANARMKRGEGIRAPDVAANRAHEALGEAIAETTDGFGTSVVPNYFATRENYAKWLPWQHAANDKAREWTTDFFGNLVKRKDPLYLRFWRGAKEHTFPIFSGEATPGKARQLYDLGSWLEGVKFGSGVFRNPAKAGVESNARADKGVLETIGRNLRGKFGTAAVAGNRFEGDGLDSLLYETYGWAPEDLQAANEAYIREHFGIEE